MARKRRKESRRGRWYSPEIRLKKKQAFLAAYAITGVIAKAAEAAGIERHCHSEWIKSDPEYREKFAEAQQTAIDRMEAEAVRRAVDGVLRFKFYKGEPILDPRTGQPYYEVEYSDTLLMFLLNGFRPEKYKYRSEVTGPDGGPVSVQHSSNITREVIKQLHELPEFRAAARRRLLAGGDTGGAGPCGQPGEVDAGQASDVPGRDSDGVRGGEHRGPGQGTDPPG